MKIVGAVVGFLAFVALLVAGARYMALRDQPPKRPSTVVAAPLPSTDDDVDDDQPRQKIPLPKLVVYRDGKEIQLAGPRKRPMLLHLWASWCGPCKLELPGLLAYGKTGPAEVVAVSVDDYWEPVVKYFHNQIPGEVVWDKTIALEKALEVESIPTTFLVDASGNVLDRFDGAHDWNNPELKKVIEEDLKP